MYNTNEPVFYARLSFDNGAAWPHQIHLRSGHTLSHCAASDPHTETWSPDESDQSRGAKTETDFVMTHPDNKI